MRDNLGVQFSYRPCFIISSLDLQPENKKLSILWWTNKLEVWEVLKRLDLISPSCSCCLKLSTFFFTQETYQAHPAGETALCHLLTRLPEGQLRRFRVLAGLWSVQHHSIYKSYQRYSCGLDSVMTLRPCIKIYSYFLSSLIVYR